MTHRVLDTSVVVRGAILLFVAMLTTTAARSQSTGTSTSLGDSALQSLSHQIDMAVPEYPAFAILGDQPTTILRPSKLRDVAVTVANIFGNSGVLPSSFAVEFAPYSLAAGNQSLLSYQSNHLINSLRISLGTITPTSGGRDVAIGIRFTPIDGSDIRMNQPFLSSLYNIGASITQLTSNCYTQVLQSKGLTRVQYLELPAAQQASIDSLVAACAAQGSSTIPGTGKLDSQITSSRQRLQAEFWNAEILDFGLAVKGHTPDSLAKDLYADAYGFWGTYTHPLFGQSGEYLIGIRASSSRSALLDTFNTLDFSLGARLYIGSNALKGFAEYSAAGAIPLKGDGSSSGVTGSLQAGVEMRILDGIWLEGSLGLKHVPGMPVQLTDALNLRLAALP